MKSKYYIYIGVNVHLLNFGSLNVRDTLTWLFFYGNKDKKRKFKVRGLKMILNGRNEIVEMNGRNEKFTLLGLHPYIHNFRNF